MADSSTDLERDAPEEHPDAPEIRRQVEYYFSDENLPTDLHLLQCCGGRENIPVSLNRIRGFKKMRRWKDKKLVLDALRKSATLDVSEDGKTIKRKVPLRGLCALDPGFLEGFKDDDIAYHPKLKKLAQYPVPLLPQKKKEYPPGTSKNMMKPTGFESHVEDLLTLQEAEEEIAMYDPQKPFVDRIEIAIQRFKQKRRMHEIYSKIFNKWMKFGGVDCTPRMFSGLTPQEMKEMTGEEIARAQATHNVPWDREDETRWVVDFDGVAAAFLSAFYPNNYGYEPHGVKTACQVLRSFLNYLLYHNVCPEHAASIHKALTICDTAQRELPKLYNAGLNLPGAYNKAASTLFGGSHMGTFTGDAKWAEGFDLNDIGVRNEEARITFATAVCIHGTDEQFNMIEPATKGSTRNTSAFRIKNDFEVSLEVLSIDVPTAETVDFYVKQNDLYTNKKMFLEPTGIMTCCIVSRPSPEDYDLPADYDMPTVPKDPLNFWVESPALENCFVGMKMHARVLGLTGGLYVLDEVREVLTSFWTCLPNEMWMIRKPKEVRIMDRAMPGYEEPLDLEDGEEVSIVQGRSKGDAEKDGDGDEVPEDEFDDE
ncbi:hypothetical protein BS50DRAFT_680422 [Corynespora cassiicola Philippines]|uniref:HTH La-type RNA-binding domain-containing protein n=1 Tax=Corynespora cassiicola Philippines TaxID=1448308 RepID=A0A2T2N9R6_CORCC|nr:hypothetical protein BS50DRAFT_680422 [Corynespora cassiicola Philippines]